MKRHDSCHREKQNRFHHCTGWEKLKQIDGFKQPVSLMLTRKIHGTNKTKKMRRLGSIYGGSITILAMLFAITYFWMGIREMFNGKKDIYINQTIENMFKEPDNEVFIQKNVFLPTFKINLNALMHTRTGD